jgi:hypothetical protein
MFSTEMAATIHAHSTGFHDQFDKQDVWSLRKMASSPMRNSFSQTFLSTSIALWEGKKRYAITLDSVGPAEDLTMVPK